MMPLNAELIQRALQETALHAMGQRSTKRAMFVVDATSLAARAISTFFINRNRNRGQELPWRYWLKWVVFVETEHQLLLAQITKRGPYNDCALLRPVVDIAHQMMPACVVLADAEYDTERNCNHISEIHYMKSIIPTTQGRKIWHLGGIRAQ